MSEWVSELYCSCGSQNGSHICYLSKQALTVNMTIREENKCKFRRRCIILWTEAKFYAHQVQNCNTLSFRPPLALRVLQTASLLPLTDSLTWVVLCSGLWGTSSGLEEWCNVTYYTVWRHHELVDERRCLCFNLSHHNFCGVRCSFKCYCIAFKCVILFDALAAVLGATSKNLLARDFEQIQQDVRN
jgi:hypothetical protein